MELQYIDIQILKIAQKADVLKMGLRQLGRLINDSNPEHPQTVKRHLATLKEAGLLNSARRVKSVLKSKGLDKKENIFKLKILGYANCGEAKLFAEENLEGYLKVSKKVFKGFDVDKLFVIRAVGNSLNQAFDLDGGPVEEGDYVIIDSSQRNPDNGAYVLSIVDDVANLKKFYRDETTGEITLVSESTAMIPPIIINPADRDSYSINGKVVRVVKNKPKK